ncbi:hypothetical protein [Verrucomicrobium sp. BvORR106]|uniref:hypothetical protein n=1 Tax=Verrucomicrobium sp. BvORR106 TaxID=1403819 RepID=UPI0005719B16|nr:hypothetical protein [Verrucomicrobium sp. BvORR106]
MIYSSAQSYILSPEKVMEWHQKQKTPLPPELKAGAVFDKVKKHLPRAKDSLPVLDANLADQALIDQAEKFLRDHPVVDAPGAGRILLAHPEKGSLRTRAEHLVASHAVTDSYKMGPRISKPEKSLSLPAMVQTVADYHLILEHKGARIYVRCYVNGDIHAVFTSANAINTPHGPVQETLSSQRILKDGLDGAKIIKVRE